MNQSRWERFAAAGGAMFAVLLMTGLVLGSLRIPGPDAGREEVLAHFTRAILSTAAFAGGLAMAALLLVASAVGTAVSSTEGFFDAYRVDADTPLLLSSLWFWLQGYALVAGGVLAAATSIVALRTRILPRWLAIAGLVLGVVGSFGETAMGLLVPFPVLMVWILVVSVLLAVRGPRIMASERAAVAGRPQQV